MDLGLAGRTAVITGGSGGIGRGLVLEFAREGCNVISASRDDATGRKLAEEARQMGLTGRILAVKTDVTQRGSVDAMVELAAAGRRPRRIVDLGCGSGILALAAARLFPAAQRIVAVDNDPEATETTRENAEHNQLGERLEIFTGTALELGDDFDLILANIRPSVLIPIADQLARRLAPGGLVMLSGILGEEA